MFLTYFSCSYLKIMDAKIKTEKGDEYDVKFNDEIIEEYFQSARKYVVELFINKITCVSKEIDLDENNETENRMVQTTSNNDSDDDDVFNLDLYQALKTEQDKRRSNDGIKTQQILREEFETKISKQFETYYDECGRLDLEEYVLLYKNSKYDAVTKKGTEVLVDKIKNKIDLAYITSITDVTNYWKNNNLKYEELSVAALILLGKPTHNAFQERVFSRGTYTDTNLKKRLKATSFEMSVLNAVNINSLVDIQEEIDEINKSYEVNIPSNRLKLNELERVQKYNEIVNEQRLSIIYDVETYEETTTDETESVMDNEVEIDLSDDDSVESNFSTFVQEYKKNSLIENLNQNESDDNIKDDDQKTGENDNMDEDIDDEMGQKPKAKSTKSVLEMVVATDHESVSTVNNNNDFSDGTNNETTDNEILKSTVV
jgi:hAT family C-terminal dimerisation region